MTEENQKKMYDNFIKLGLLKKAEAISKVPRYNHFSEKKEETKSKGKK